MVCAHYNLVQCLNVQIWHGNIFKIIHDRIIFLCAVSKNVIALK